MNKKVLILGLDGAALPLIEKWAAAGELPNFARLMNEGVWGKLKSTPSFGSASAWPSFHTGLNPGRHGMFDFFYQEKNSYNMQWMTKRYFTGKTFWETASEQNVKSTILNLPVTYPAAPFKGYQIAGWMTPNSSAKGFTYPAELGSEIRDSLGKHIFSPSVKAEVNRGRYEAAFNSMQETFAYKLRLCRWMMEKYDTGIFAHAWIAHDQLGHYLWHLIDPGHPRYDAGLAEKYDHIALEVYKMSDRAIGELHGKFGGNLIIMSDHGHGPNPLGEPHLKSLLKETGYMKMKSGAGKQSSLFSRMVANTFDVLQGLLGRPVKRFLIANFPGLLNFALTRQNLSDVEWGETTVYTFIEPTVNLQGREPEGIVPPEEQDRILSEIEGILYSARDTRSGRKAIEKIYRKEDVYHGHYTENAPDLLIVWKADLVVESLELEYKGRKIVTKSHYADHRSGNHKPYGIFFAEGEAFRPGVRDDSVEIIDLCPLILHLAGCKIPGNLDGRIPEDVLSESFLRDNPPEYFEIQDSCSAGHDDYSTPEEKAAAEKRLSDLGYM